MYLTGQPSDIGIPSMHTGLIQPFLEGLTQPFQKIAISTPNMVSNKKNEWTTSHESTNKANALKAMVINYMRSNVSTHLDNLFNGKH